MIRFVHCAPSVCSLPARLLSALFSLLFKFLVAPFTPRHAVPESLLPYHMPQSCRVLHPWLSSSAPHILHPSSCHTIPSLVKNCFTSLTSNHVANSLRPHRVPSSMRVRFLEHHPPSLCCPRTHVILFLPTFVSHVIRLLIDRFPSVRLHLDQKCGTRVPEPRAP